LFFAEGHYKKTKEFWSYFLEGLRRHKVEPPIEFLLNELEKRAPAFWEHLLAAVESDYLTGETNFLSESDRTALRFLFGVEEIVQVSEGAATT